MAGQRRDPEAPDWPVAEGAGQALPEAVPGQLNELHSPESGVPDALSQEAPH